MCGALVDSRANGGLFGNDVHVLEHAPNGFMNVTGIAGNEVTNLKLAQAAASVETMADCPIVVIVSQCANFGEGKMIHSKGQMEHFGLLIDNKLHTLGSKQCIITPEGHSVPVHMHDRLPCIDMRIPAEAEMDKYPHVFLTVDLPGDPAALDNEFDGEFHNTVTELPEVKNKVIVPILALMGADFHKHTKISNHCIEHKMNSLLLTLPL